MVISMKAIVRRVVDGDTLILDIYLGVVVSLEGVIPSVLKLPMDLYIDPTGALIMGRVRTRLYKYYAAEMGTPEGILARDMLAAVLPLGMEVDIELHGKDKYGRWLVVPMVGTTNICLSLGNGIPQGNGIPIHKAIPEHPSTAGI